jgi:hypothetical protein
MVTTVTPMGAAYAASVWARQNLSTSGTAVPNTLKAQAEQGDQMFVRLTVYLTKVITI